MQEFLRKTLENIYIYIYKHFQHICAHANMIHNSSLMVLENDIKTSEWGRTL
uniref:Uncharacterized protein n=1 Tax=Octopus bimaculoides TaxID=37653 RepID=A0A0L8I5M9_OCTBM